MAARKGRLQLQQDAEALFDAATAFIRVYQFRSRHEGLRFGLTVVQAYALDGLIAGGGESLTGLARRLHLDKSTASRVVAGMERNGLVEWSHPDHDRRAKQIVASREGKRRYASLRGAIVDDNARLLAGYAPPARRAVIGALRRLTERALAASAVSTERRGPR
jgi:DNA-binding MarR family transcriptional regulator